INLPSSIMSSLDGSLHEDPKPSERSFPENLGSGNTPVTPKVYVPTNPRGAESLPPGIVVSETDFYLRRLWGEPSEDLKKKPKYLVTFTVGFDQRHNIDAAIKKFSEDFQIMLFHYDGRTSEWDEFEWSKRAVHVSIRKQTKWWYAKRFLHPDVIAAYDYIFIWDEDLGVEHFNADKYVQLIRKHGLDISQPGLEPNNGLTWQMTKRRGDREVHKLTHICAQLLSFLCLGLNRDTDEKPVSAAIRDSRHDKSTHQLCQPYISLYSQNDLVHGWGLDFALRRCVEPAHEKIGVVDSQWVVHQVIPSLGNQGESENGKAPWQGVRERCRSEWAQFQDRLANADKAYFAQRGRG
ncbi:hypothetical protein RJ639_042709, partial [Escallonia herrerae]